MRHLHTKWWFTETRWQVHIPQKQCLIYRKWYQINVRLAKVWTAIDRLSMISISSSSCCTISTDIPDPFSPPLPIVHFFWQFLRTTSRIGIELLNVGSSWSSCLCSATRRGPQEYITYELIPNSPAVSHMSFI